MVGTWEQIGEGRFALDPKIAVEVYRWHAPQRDGACIIEFQSPKEYPHRRFYPVEVLESLKRNEPADDYVERMCRLGISLLPETELVMRQLVQATTGNDDGYAGKEMPTQESLEFLMAVFDSRRGGHHRVTRDFHREDDFYAKGRSRKKDDFLVPGVEPPRRVSKLPLKGQDVIRHVAAALADNPSSLAGRGDQELQMFLSPMRTPLDQVLVEGVLRTGDAAKTRTINDIANMIAPALIDGIEVHQDGLFLADNLDEFHHFRRRLDEKWCDDRAGFCSWLRQEREKGFVRLLPGYKGFSVSAREMARDKGTRFYRRILWTSYEAMSRCFGVAALHMWVSFFQSEVIRPSLDEQRSFRCYHAPLALAAGLPLWFFGPNVLRWVMEGFIDRVWGWKEGQDFDSLTDLIALYGQIARERRHVDAEKKRMKKVAENRPDLLAESQEVQYEETIDGRAVANPIPTVLPADVPGDGEADCPDLPPTRSCPCGGRLNRIGDKPTVTDSWMLVDTECAVCEREQTYRIPRPPA
jgi:hypothetical protein